jgi:NAD(P)-dependent dehydrogenase (short-subunit alcohol dehydrogenase family)
MLAARGYDLALAGRRPDKLRETAAQLSGGPALELRADVGDHADATAIIDRTLDRFGRLDVLINNAGSAPLLPIEAHTPDLLDEIYRTNAIGPAITIARAWPVFKQQRSGCIINVSTMATIDPFAGFFGYAAAKASVNLMAFSCAKEGKPFGVRAFAVAPGAVETQMLRSLFPETQLPRNRVMPPERIASVIVECITGEHDDKNGQVIVVNDPARQS